MTETLIRSTKYSQLFFFINLVTSLVQDPISTTSGETINTVYNNIDQVNYHKNNQVYLGPITTYVHYVRRLHFCIYSGVM